MVVATAVGLAIASTGTALAATTTVSPTPSPSPGFDGTVYAMAYSGSTLYVGGDFTHAIVGGKKYLRNRLAAINMQTGGLLGWAPSADSSVRALAVDPANGTVYAGGSFVAISGQSRTALAQLDPGNGAVLGFTHVISGTVRSLAAGNGRVYAGGRLYSVDGQTVSNMVAFTSIGGQVDTGFQASTDDVVDAMVATATRLYIGGIFKLVNGQNGTAKLAALDPATGARDATFWPKVTIRVFALAVGPRGVYTALGGQGGRAIAFDFSGKPQWTTTADGDVQAVAVMDDVVYLGGHFDNVCSTNVNGVQGTCTDGSVWRVKLAAVDAASGTLLGWDPHANGINGVLAMVANTSLTSGTVAAGGEFTTIGGMWWPRFAEFAYPTSTATLPRAR